MKHLPYALLAAASVAVASSPAQAQGFRVARPANGATVRETVRITIPRSSLDGAKYFSLSIDDKFRTALSVPSPPTGNKIFRSEMVEASSKNVAILWDTKAATSKGASIADPNADKNTAPPAPQNVPDGQHTVEIIAHDASGKRVGRQVLTLNVNNQGNLAMPSDGIALNYRFQVGDQSQYQQITSLKYVGEAPPPQRERPNYGAGYRQGGGASGGFGGSPSGSGGPPSGYGSSYGSSYGGRSGGGMMSGSGPGGGMRGMGGGGGGMMSGSGPGGGMRGGYGGGYGGGSGPGTGYSAQPSGPYLLPVQDVRAVYERSTEDFVGGSQYFLRDKVTDGTIIGGNGTAALLNQIYDFKSRYRTVTTSGKVVANGVASAARPGAYVALPIPNIGGGKRRINQTWKSQTPILLEWASLDQPAFVNADNRLVGLEWQDNYQTARIEQTYNGKASLPLFGGVGKMQDANVKMTRTIWFAYKAGKVVRTETTLEVDGQAPSDILSAMVPGANLGNAGVGGGVGGSGGYGAYGGGAAFGGDGADGAGFGGGMPSGVGGGLGGMQQQAEAPKVPAKFISVTTVTLKK